MFVNFAAASLPVSAAEPLNLRNHFLGIGNCPPWHPQSVEICRHSLEKVVSALAPRIGTGPETTHLLINEGASAPALKRKAMELASKLGTEDRLIIYANLPLAPDEDAGTDESTGFALELWADQKPVSTEDAIGSGTWISASAFASMIHTISAAEVILILDTNNSNAVNLTLLEENTVDLKERPEALVTSASPGQAANYSADRTISLFAKHLAAALNVTEGSLLEVMTAAASGTRQAAIPICASLKAHKSEADSGQSSDCTQVPEIHDPDALLDHIALAPLPVSEVN
ncbi:hypothetical protein FMN50_02730 [Rhodobacterales bacterium]|nr:hypothetical protein FMN50_02730 [Rhodobacterales bacterium]